MDCLVMWKVVLAGEALTVVTSDFVCLFAPFGFFHSCQKGGWNESCVLFLHCCTSHLFCGVVCCMDSSDRWMGTEGGVSENDGEEASGGICSPKRALCTVMRLDVNAYCSGVHRFGWLYVAIINMIHATAMSRRNEMTVLPNGSFRW